MEPLIVCSECGTALNENTETVWHKVEGWEKPRTGGGTNHVALRRQLDVFMCNGCMTSLQAGRSPLQESMSL